MTIPQFRNIIMTIVIIALLELVLGVFYFAVVYKPNKQAESLRLQETLALEEKKLEQERILEETLLKEKTRMEEIRLEVKQIDLEQARIDRWAEAGDELEKLRLAEEEAKGKQASLNSCMKIVVENYHNQWNLFCEKLELPSSCSMPTEYSSQINGDYEIGKTQCENFFK